MTVVVVLLRAVNVGGTGKLAMADLRNIAISCGYEHVRTHIQSGNMVLATTASPGELSDELRRGIAATAGVNTDVIVRTLDEFDAVVTGNPFLARGADPSRLHVMFLDNARPPNVDLVDLDRYLPDEAVARNGEIYLHLPDGMGRSKLATELGRRFRAGGTVRNWRTVTTLHTMAAEIE